MESEKIMSLFDLIEEDFKNALKAKDEAVLNTLRLLKSSIKNKEIEKKESLKEEEVLELVMKEIKKRKEAEDLYTKAGRGELAEKENQEIKILEKYAPEGLSDDELLVIIKEEISALGAEGPQDIGKVMSRVMPRVKGRADGNIVSKKVAELLNP